MVIVFIQRCSSNLCEHCPPSLFKLQVQARSQSTYIQIQTDTDPDAFNIVIRWTHSFRRTPSGIPFLFLFITSRVIRPAAAFPVSIPEQAPFQPTAMPGSHRSSPQTRPAAARLSCCSTASGRDRWRNGVESWAPRKTRSRMRGGGAASASGRRLGCSRGERRGRGLRITIDAHK